MTMKDADAFFEPRLRFGIRKPANWRFVPPRWSPVAHLKNRAGDDAADWVRYSKLPFVTMMGHHDSEQHPYPTVNVGCRPGWVTPNLDYEGLSRQAAEFFVSHHEAADILERSPDALVDGRRALYLKCRYLLVWDRAGEEYRALTLSRSYTIFHNGLVFTMGMTSSAEEEYYREMDFDQVLASVRVGVGLT